jgi:hypothetical protein
MTDITLLPRNRESVIPVALRGRTLPGAGFIHRLRDGWPLFLDDRNLPVALRTVFVAGALSVMAVIAFAFATEDDSLPVERGSRVARIRNVGALLAMANGGADDETALDSDFSLEQAARTWSHRLTAHAEAEADQPGVLHFGPVKVHQSIVEHVVKAAQTTEMDPALLMAIADKESNFITRAKARTSSASGLFQFVERTWLHALRTFGGRYGREQEARAIAGDERVTPQQRAKILGLRNDPYLSAALAAEMLKKDGAKIAERIGRPLTPGETYLIHFLGPDDAERFMKKMDEAPHVSAAALLPRPARANRPIFYEQQGRHLKTRSVAEVHEAFEAMMGKRTSRYEDVASRLPEGVTAYAE